MTLGSRTHRVTTGFLTGGFVAFACSILLPVMLDVAAGAVSLPRSLAALRWSAPTSLSLVIGGVVAGTALDAGRRGRAATGLAMLAAGTIQSYVFGYLDRLTGREDPVLVVAFAVSAGVLGYALAGIIASVTLRLEQRRALGAAARSAAAGALGSLPAVAPFFVIRAGGEAVLGGTFVFVLLFCQALSILIPFLGCGLALGQALD